MNHITVAFPIYIHGVRAMQKDLQPTLRQFQLTISNRTLAANYLTKS